MNQAVFLYPGSDEGRNGRFFVPVQGRDPALSAPSIARENRELLADAEK
jgi:hypothetical protein